LIPAKFDKEVEIAIVGAGIAGIAAAYYLSAIQHKKSVLLIDSRQPMSFTSAQSGDNYRNWWPHPTMTDFTNDSIDELDRLTRESDDFFHMTRGGYCLATRQSDVDNILAAIPGDIAVDVLSSADRIRESFPALSAEIQNVIHIRRGGDINGDQLGQYLLQNFGKTGGQRMRGHVTSINAEDNYQITASTNAGVQRVKANIVVNAAGPFVGRIARMLGVELPVKNIFQQKIAFEDHLGAIPRDMPFSIDLDAKRLNWSDDERRLLMDDPELAWLADTLPGGTHCRPDGGRNGKRVKLGWAYNDQVSEVQEDLANEPAIDAGFPEIVIRGVASFIPAMQAYVSEPPQRFAHYGGYYTMTNENWPLIGPLDGRGAFVIAALSGFGSMAACAAGKLCAAHICDAPLPAYAADLSLSRLEDTDLMASLLASESKGLL
jgi:glycine/D-amino acid oxidase-like deaminating enzyme